MVVTEASLLIACECRTLRCVLRVLGPVPLPTPDDRVSILRAVCRKMAIDKDTVDLEVVTAIALSAAPTDRSPGRREPSRSCPLACCVPARSGDRQRPPCGGLQWGGPGSPGARGGCGSSQEPQEARVRGGPCCRRGRYEQRRHKVRTPREVLAWLAPFPSTCVSTRHLISETD